MTEARDRWSDENGFWVVDDEYGDEWEVITTGNRAMLVQREDGQRYYGAVWVGGDGVGELHPRSAGDVEDGYDCNQRYEFSETHGWEMLDQQDEEGEGETVTTLEIGGRVFELTDETSRLVAADALQEAGFEAEAAAMRAGTPVVSLLNGRFAVLDAGRLEQELRRLGVATTRVYFDGHLPAGLVRVSDGTGTVHGDPEAFADSLAGLEDDAGFDAVWDVLGEVGTGYDCDYVYEYYKDHLSDRFHFEQVGEGTLNDNPMTVYTVASNGGIAYLAGPDGMSESAVLEWFRNTSMLAPTREEALRWAGWEGGAA